MPELDERSVLQDRRERLDRLFDDENTHQAIRQNIETICRLEERYQTNRKLSERIASAIGSFSGSLSFIVFQAVVISLWILVNTKRLPLIPVFDPYPFNLLNMGVSIEAVFLSTFVMVKQNRMSKRADSRAHLDLQINLLAENEMTAMLQMLRLIANKVGVRAPDLEGSLEQLAKETPIEVMAHAIEHHFPNED